MLVTNGKSKAVWHMLMFNALLPLPDVSVKRGMFNELEAVAHACRVEEEDPTGGTGA